MSAKKFGAWWLPAHEKHLQPWMEHPKNRDCVLNGRVAYQGRKQLAALELVKLYRAGQPLRTAVDVGGHCGLWSFNLAHWFAQVHAFEPMALHRECFVLNVQCASAAHQEEPEPDNPPAQRRGVHLHCCALGAAPGSVRLESQQRQHPDRGRWRH